MKNHRTATPEQVSQTRKILKSVQAADEVREKSKRRFAPYKYLKSAYRAYLHLKEQKLIKTLPMVAANEFGIRVRPGWDPIRVVIEATSCHRDPQVRSRWCRALEFAERRAILPDELLKAFRSHGGIAGLARLAAQAMPKRKSSCWNEGDDDEDELEDGYIDDDDFDDDEDC